MHVHVCKYCMTNLKCAHTHMVELSLNYNLYNLHLYEKCFFVLDIWVMPHKQICIHQFNMYIFIIKTIRQAKLPENVY